MSRYVARGDFIVVHVSSTPLTWALKKRNRNMIGPRAHAHTLDHRALLVPTLGGVFLFADQMRTGSPDSPLLPIFCVLIMVRNME